MVIVIIGPTAIGKTRLSIELAKSLDGEIINADSTQVYKELNIATAKITEEEKEGIPHHLFDIKSIDEDYSVFEYQNDCRKKIAEILNRKHVPILVGGTGLYIKAALYDYKFNENNNKNDYQKYSNDELFQKLLKVDSTTTIHKNNRKRVERALDYYYSTGKPFSKKSKSVNLLYDAIFIGLTSSREEIYNRINDRVLKMVDNGLLFEAKKIYNSNIRTKAVMTPIGYKELFPYFDNTRSLEESLEEIKRNSRRYAKRQFTWFRNQLPTIWFEVDFDDFSNTVKDVMEYLNQNLEIKKK